MRTPNHLWLPLILVSAVAACGGGEAATPGATAPTAATTTAPTDPSIPKAPDHPESDKVTWKKDSPAKSCHTGAKGDGDLAAAVTGLASSCVAKMHLVGQPMTGVGAASTATMIKQIPFAAQANHCYRFFGLSQASVKDLDIAVTDSAGKSCGEDLNDSNDAIVLEDGSICFKADDAASINVAVGTGSGKWAVEVWSE
jgi:hypothetical protein